MNQRLGLPPPGGVKLRAERVGPLLSTRWTKFLVTRDKKMVWRHHDSKWNYSMDLRTVHSHRKKSMTYVFLCDLFETISSPYKHLVRYDIYRDRRHRRHAKLKGGVHFAEIVMKYCVFDVHFVRMKKDIVNNMKMLLIIRLTDIILATCTYNNIILFFIVTW